MMMQETALSPDATFADYYLERHASLGFMTDKEKIDHYVMNLIGILTRSEIAQKAYDFALSLQDEHPILVSRTDKMIGATILTRESFARVKAVYDQYCKEQDRDSYYAQF